MANLTSVGVSSGVPNSGTGTVSTIDALMADGGQATIGAKADTAYSDGTGAASGSEISLLKGAFVKLASLVTEAFGKGTSSSPSTDVLTVGGDTASGSTDAGWPHKIGFKAKAGLSGVTLVSADQRMNAHGGLDGAIYMRPHCGLEDIVSGVAAITDGSSTSVLAAAGSSIKQYITTAIISNTSATAVTVDLRDGAAGTVKATFPVPANTSGVVCNLPIPLGFSANTAICADPSASVSTVTVTLIGFKSKI